MPRTMILGPLKSSNKIHKENYKKIQTFLNSEEIKTLKSFDEFLDFLCLNETSYFSALKSNIKRPTVFLKRSPTEIRINPYNPQILKLWKANTDI